MESFVNDVNWFKSKGIYLLIDIHIILNNNIEDKCALFNERIINDKTRDKMKKLYSKHFNDFVRLYNIINFHNELMDIKIHNQHSIYKIFKNCIISKYENAIKENTSVVKSDKEFYLMFELIFFLGYKCFLNYKHILEEIKD